MKWIETLIAEVTPLESVKFISLLLSGWPPYVIFCRTRRKYYFVLLK